MCWFYHPLGFRGFCCDDFIVVAFRSEDKWKQECGTQSVLVHLSPPAAGIESSIVSLPSVPGKNSWILTNTEPAGLRAAVQGQCTFLLTCVCHSWFLHNRFLKYHWFNVIIFQSVNSTEIYWASLITYIIMLGMGVWGWSRDSLSLQGLRKTQSFTLMLQKVLQGGWWGSLVKGHLTQTEREESDRFPGEWCKGFQKQHDYPGSSTTFKENQLLYLIAVQDPNIYHFYFPKTYHVFGLSISVRPQIKH